VLNPNVLYTPHALSLIRPFIYTDFNARIFGGPLMWPTISTRPPSRPSPHRCRCLMPMPMSGPVHKPPRLELELVPVKRLTARLWWPTCLVGDGTCTVLRGDVSPYSLTSVHVAKSTLPSLFHSLFAYLFEHFYLEHPTFFSPNTSSPFDNHFKVYFLPCNCLWTIISMLFNMLITALRLFIFLAPMIVVLCSSACLLCFSKTHAFLLLSVAFCFSSLF